MRRLHRFLLIVILAALLAACAAPAPRPASTPTTAPLPLPTRIPPTQTAEPSSTPLPSFTPTTAASPTLTATPAPTIDPALETVELIGMSWYSNYDMLLSFQFAAPVNPAAYRVTLEDKDYTCEVIAKHADRLYCRGPGSKVLAVAHVRIYPVGSPLAVFEKEIWIPYFDNDYNTYNQ
jgi:hypothetical protein